MQFERKMRKGIRYHRRMLCMRKGRSKPVCGCSCWCIIFVEFGHSIFDYKPTLHTRARARARIHPFAGCCWWRYGVGAMGCAAHSTWTGDPFNLVRSDRFFFSLSLSLSVWLLPSQTRTRSSSRRRVLIT